MNLRNAPFVGVLAGVVVILLATYVDAWAAWGFYAVFSGVIVRNAWRARAS